MESFIIWIPLIIFGSLLAGLFIICWTIVKLVGWRDSRNTSDEEARLMQEIHQGLTKMEQRVETLETLLLEREPGGRP